MALRGESQMVYGGSLKMRVLQTKTRYRDSPKSVKGNEGSIVKCSVIGVNVMGRYTLP